MKAFFLSASVISDIFPPPLFSGFWLSCARTISSYGVPRFQERFLNNQVSPLFCLEQWPFQFMLALFPPLVRTLSRGPMVSPRWRFFGLTFALSDVHRILSLFFSALSSSHDPFRERKIRVSRLTFFQFDSNFALRVLAVVSSHRLVGVFASAFSSSRLLKPTDHFLPLSQWFSRSAVP